MLRLIYSLREDLTMLTRSQLLHNKKRPADITFKNISKHRQYQ